MNSKETIRESTDIEPGSARTPEDDTTPEGQEPKEREIGGRKGPDPTRYGDWERPVAASISSG